MTEGWLRHRLGDFTLDVRWSVGEGQVLTLFGPSGAGKSTTLRAIAGLLRPDEGRIAIAGDVVFESAGPVWTPPHERRVGYLPQRFALFPHLTAGENVAFGVRSWPKAERGRRVDELLEMLHVAGLAERRPSQLSAGQQQRVALARALAPRPRLLLLDEPFSALDYELRRELRRELRAVRDRTGIPMVLVTHDPADALALSDRVIALDNGRVAAEGPPLEVLGRPATEPLARLTEVENVFEGTVTEQAPADGVMRCDAGGMPLVAPYAPVPVGARVRVGLRAGDILVAAERPQGLSAQNTLPGVVTAIERRGFETVVVADCGRFLRQAPSTGPSARLRTGQERLLRAEVTPRAVERLGLAPGKDVWLVFKSNSCFLIE